MATITQAPAFYHSGPHVIKWVGEASSQSFLKGQMVYLASGLATVCADDAQTIYGMALADASTAATTTPTVPVLIANPGTEFVMNIYKSSSAVTALSNVGENYAIIISSNKCYCNADDTTNISLVVRELYAADAIGDTYGRVVVSVMPYNSQVCDVGHA